jgi:hypothetical protein
MNQPPDLLCFPFPMGRVRTEGDWAPSVGRINW